MTTKRKQTIVALLSASFLSTSTALAQQATNHAAPPQQQQSTNQVVGKAEPKPAEAERPRSVSPADSTNVAARPAPAAALELAAVIPAPPNVIKRSANSVAIPVDLRAARRIPGVPMNADPAGGGDSTLLKAPLSEPAKPSGAGANASANPGGANANDKSDAKGPSKTTPKYESRMVSSTAQVGSTFGYRSDPFTRRAKFHAGCDIKAHWGESVGASLGGVIQYAGWYHGYGNIIIINHGGGITTHYAHLSSFDVQIGQRVERGQIVGRAGSTGRATSAHLHYEVRVDGNPVNPFQPLALDPSSEFFRLNPSVSGKPEIPRNMVRLISVP